MECQGYSDRAEARRMPLPRSPRRSGRKPCDGPEAGGQGLRRKNKMPSRQTPDQTVAGSSKRRASRSYQVKTGHCLTGQYPNRTESRPIAHCRWWKESGRGRASPKIQRLLADVRCSQAVTAGLPLHHGCGKASAGWGRRRSKASEWERKEERRQAEELGAEVRNNLCFSPRPRSWHPRKRTRGWVSISFVLSFLSFPCDFFGAHCIFWGQAWAEGKGGQRGACNVSPPRGQRTGIRQNARHHSLYEYD